MSKAHAPIALFYGSSTCYTEMAAEKIRAYIGESRVDLFNIADTELETCLEYDNVIFGIPTWDYGELQEDWEDNWDSLQQLDFSGKTVAIFGLGDQIGYPQWFQDAVGYLHDCVVVRGARTVGAWPVDGYTFEQSKALNSDETHFVGLALDDENEFDLSDTRIQQWCDAVLMEFNVEKQAS